MGIFLGLLTGSFVIGLYGWSRALTGKPFELDTTWAGDFGEDIGEGISNTTLGLGRGLSPILISGLALYATFYVMDNYVKKRKYRKKK